MKTPTLLHKWLLISMLCAVTAAHAQKEAVPVLITYGAQADPVEGDPDQQQTFFIGIPQGQDQAQYFLRIFDADTGGQHDSPFSGGFNTEIRYVLSGQHSIFAEALSERQREVLYASDIGIDTRYDNQWATVAVIDSQQGQLIDGVHYFRLDVIGLKGNDANVYDVIVTESKNALAHAPAVRLFVNEITVRIRDEQSFVETTLEIPQTTESIELNNFDFVGAEALLSFNNQLAVLSVPGQGEWSQDVLPFSQINEYQPKVLVSGGNEIPNDITFYARDQDGRPLSIKLPLKEKSKYPGVGIDLSSEYARECHTVSFQARKTSGPERIKLSYIWDFGDGVSLQRDTGEIEHRYRESGDYTVKLRVVPQNRKIWRDSEAQINVHIPQAPEFDMGANRVVEINQPLWMQPQALTQGSGDALTWQWDFGDGTTTDTGARVRHQWSQAGTYTVTVQADNGERNACGQTQDAFTVLVNTPPVAEAGPDQTLDSSPIAVLSAAASSDAEDSVLDYTWDLGDGNQKQGRDIRHYYDSPGRYEVLLTVKDRQDSQAQDSVDIHVPIAPLRLNRADTFNISIGQGVGLKVLQNKNANTRKLRYEWQVADSQVRAAGPSLEHAFNEPGTYTIQLSAYDLKPPYAEPVTATVTAVVNSVPVAVTDRSSYLVLDSLLVANASNSYDQDNQQLSYLWDMGDGTTLSGERIEHRYQAAGRYTLKLTAVDDSGTSRSSGVTTAQVLVNTLPIADAGPDQQGVIDEEIHFDAGLSIDPDEHELIYRWDFGDGNNAEGQLVRHSYQQTGSYDVQLLIYETINEQVLAAVDTVHVHINEQPVAMIRGPKLARPNELVRLSAQNSYDPDGSIERYQWSIDALDLARSGRQLRYRFQKSGLYEVKLRIEDGSGANNGAAVATHYIRINTPPVAAMDYDLDENSYTARFSAKNSFDADADLLTYRWNFGDGSPEASGVEAIHNYQKGGIYPVRLIVTDGDDPNQSGSSEQTRTITINRPPTARIRVSDAVCSSENVLFDASASSDPDRDVLRYQWDFGDGNRSEGISTNHRYQASGNYWVNLTVTDDSGLGRNQHTAQSRITVYQSPLAEAGDDIRVCSNEIFTLDGSDSNQGEETITRFTWHMGDGSVKEGVRVSHSYPSAGIYNVLLSAYGESAGSCPQYGNDEVTVRVLPGMEARFDVPEVIAPAETFSVNARSSLLGSKMSVRYGWDFGDGNTASGEQAQHSYADPGVYQIKLSIAAADSEGECNNAQVVHHVRVNARPVATIDAPKRVGVHQPIRFNGLESYDPDDSISSYEWDFGDGTQASGGQVFHQYNEPGSYKVTLRVTDDVRLKNSVGETSQTIQVQTADSVLVRGPALACVGSSHDYEVDDTNQSVQDASYRWRMDAQNWQTAKPDGKRFSHRFETPGLHTVLLEANDGQGLSTSVRLGGYTTEVVAKPQAQIIAPVAACMGEDIALQAANPQAHVRYRWLINGIEAAEASASITHALTASGEQNISLRAEDTRFPDCFSEAQKTIAVNAPPQARWSAGGTTTVTGAHDRVLLDASGSSDPNDDVLSYRWDLGDGTIASGPRVSHRYEQAGSYRVILTVSDGSATSCAQSSHSQTMSLSERK